MRVLFTVALAVAVLAVALPAVEVSSVDSAESRSRAAVDRLVDAARTLSAGNDALAAPQDAARRTVALDLPDGGIASAGLEWLVVGPPKRPAASAREPATDGSTRRPAATRIAWRVEGGRRHVVQVDGLRLRAPDGGPVRLEGGGRRRVSLRLVERDGARVVTVASVGGRREST